jgi:hypothetical protein
VASGIALVLECNSLEWNELELKRAGVETRWIKTCGFRLQAEEQALK